MARSVGPSVSRGPSSNNLQEETFAILYKCPVERFLVPVICTSCLGLKFTCDRRQEIASFLPGKGHAYGNKHHFFCDEHQIRDLQTNALHAQRKARAHLGLRLRFGVRDGSPLLVGESSKSFRIPPVLHGNSCSSAAGCPSTTSAGQLSFPAASLGGSMGTISEAFRVPL